MATQWVLGKVSDALAPTVSGAVSSAGGFVGGAINAVGNSVNGVGDSLNRSVKTYGDGVKDYGNAVMDWTAAAGIRGATAANPLGLAGTKGQGERSATSPRVYYPPRQSPSKTLMTTSKTAAPQKKIGAAPARKALPAPEPKTATRAATSRAQPRKNIASTSKGPTPAKATTSGKKTIAASARPAASKPSKPAASATPKPVQRGNYGSGKAAENPLGLSWQ